jgi:hypothetical protein
MNLKLFVPAVCALTFSGALFPAEPMSADAVKSLLTNNTMNCTNLEKNEGFTNYFRDDGTVTKLTSGGTRKEGKWRVAEDGQHCMDWGEHERCNPVIDEGNGNYHKIESGNPRAEFTVTPGNPDNL